MKSITLWQPWASLMAVGAKRVETRWWPAPRTLQKDEAVAIHAAVRAPWKGFNEMSGMAISAAIEAFGKFGIEKPELLPTGCVVAVCVFQCCRPTDILLDEVSTKERLFGDYSAGRYGWELPLLYRLPEPIAARGQQGLWEWEAPEELVRHVEDLFTAADPLQWVPGGLQ